VPNFSGILYFADHGVQLTVPPVAVDVSRLTCQWFEDAVEGEDYDVQTLIGAFHVTNGEDAALAELTQRGVNSRRFTPGPNGATRESFLRGSLEAYLDMMEAGDAVAPV
jgi:phenylpropionate dioxygenase-like ring-hydroxylating dioxygenase large terminal subunit